MRHDENVRQLLELLGFDAPDLDASIRAALRELYERRTLQLRQPTLQELANEVAAILPPEPVKP